MNAIGSCEEWGSFRTIASFSIFIVVSASWTKLTILNADVEVLVVGARRASFFIENGLLSWASLTSLTCRNINEVFLAANALFELVVKVLRKEASYTLLISLKRLTFRTFTSLQLWIIFFAFFATDTLFGYEVEKLRRIAGDTLGSCSQVGS